MRNLWRYVTVYKITEDERLQKMALCGADICYVYNSIDRYIERTMVYKFEMRIYYDDATYIFRTSRILQTEQTGLLCGSYFLTRESLHVYIRDVQFLDLTYERGTVRCKDACTRTTIFKIRIN